MDSDPKASLTAFGWMRDVLVEMKKPLLLYHSEGNIFMMNLGEVLWNEFNIPEALYLPLHYTFNFQLNMIPIAEWGSRLKWDWNFISLACGAEPRRQEHAKEYRNLFFSVNFETLSYFEPGYLLYVKLHTSTSHGTTKVCRAPAEHPDSWVLLLQTFSSITSANTL